MKRNVRRFTAAVAALTVASAMTVSAMAVYRPAWGKWITLNTEEVESYKNEDPIYAQVNNPYININATFDEEFPEDASLLLKKGDTVIGRIKKDADHFVFESDVADVTEKAGTVDGTKIYDISGATNDDEAGFGLFHRVETRDMSKEITDFDAFTGETPLAVMGFTEIPHNYGEADEYSEYYLEPNGTAYLGYFNDKKYEVVDTMTVPAGSFLLSISEDSANRGDDSVTVGLVSVPENDDDWWKLPTVGAKKISDGPTEELIELDKGFYRLSLNGGGNIYNRSIEIKDHDVELIKIRVPASDISRFVKLDDGKYYMYGVYDDDENIAYPVGQATELDGQPCFVEYAFCSGSAITCDIPDDQGYLDLWVEKDNPNLYFETIYRPHGGGQTHVSVRLTADYQILQGVFEYPESGITLYNVPEGEYTIEVDDGGIDGIAFTLTGDTSFTVTDTQDLQQMNVSVDVEPVVTPDPEPEDEDDGEDQEEEKQDEEQQDEEQQDEDTDGEDEDEGEDEDTDGEDNEPEEDENQPEEDEDEDESTDGEDEDGEDEDEETEDDSDKGSDKVAPAGKSEITSTGTTNPKTGAFAGMGAIALAAGAVIAVAKKRK